MSNPWLNSGSICKSSGSNLGSGLNCSSTNENGTKNWKWSNVQCQNCWVGWVDACPGLLLGLRHKLSHNQNQNCIRMILRLHLKHCNSAHNQITMILWGIVTRDHYNVGKESPTCKMHYMWDVIWDLENKSKGQAVERWLAFALCPEHCSMQTLKSALKQIITAMPADFQQTLNSTCTIPSILLQGGRTLAQRHGTLSSFDWFGWHYGWYFYDLGSATSVRRYFTTSCSDAGHHCPRLFRERLVYCFI